MALAWITEIQNHTKNTVLLKQTDPSKNPAVDSVEKGKWAPGLPSKVAWSTSSGDPPVHEWFSVGPETTIKTSRFVVPWSNQNNAWVYLIYNKNNNPDSSIDLEASGIQFNVGPTGGGRDDFIQFYDRQLNPLTDKAGSAVGGGQPVTIPVGPAGATASTSGRLNITDDSITYQITASNSAGTDLLAVIMGAGQLIGSAASVVQAKAALSPGAAAEGAGKAAGAAL